MALDPGTRLGAYEIIAKIGEGGMGEVYRAREIALDRDVALKVLPELQAFDPERIARFEREARTLASLNHPNIAVIHAVHLDSGAIPFLVMELVGGHTLAERLAQGPMPPAEAVDFAVQIADGLEAAHDRGIVHRDLKPSNVKVRDDGTVKLLDFGLARRIEPSSEGSQAATSPALGVTREGTIVGTVAYMSPEQARGQVVDTRTDIWAFGALLYEMLTGRQAFGGATTSDILAGVLTRDPEWEALPASVLPRVRRLLRRCLEKDLKRRVRSIADVRIELEDAMGAADDSLRQASSRLVWTIAAISAVGAAALVAMAVWMFSRNTAVPAERTGQEATIRLSIEPPDGTEFDNQGFALSPDGRQVAFVANRRDPPGRSVWVRPLSSVVPRELPGTEGATFPFWSPDGRSLGFFAENQLKRIDLAGGTARALASTPAVPVGGTWGSRDVIVFSVRSALYAIPAFGGAVTEVAAINPAFQEDSLRFPRFLPDGTRFLFVARAGNRRDSHLYLGSLDEAAKRLFPTSSQAEYLAPGYLLSVQNGTLLARRFDSDRPQLAAGDVMLAESVRMVPGSIAAGFATSPGGVLAYMTDASTSTRLQWFSRSGEPLDTVSDNRNIAQPRLSPNGQRVAFSFDDDRDGSASVWTLDPTRPDQALSRLTFAGTHDRDPVWSPDSTRVAFSSTRRGSYALYTKATAGAATEELLLASDDDLWAEDWSADGRFIAYRRGRADTSLDVLAVPLAEPRVPIAVAQSRYSEHDARFSPDGRWIAYVSDETGRDEIFVQPFPPTGGKWQWSTEGGDDPVWRRDGRELFYIRPDGTLVCVDVTATEAEITRGAPRPLFQSGGAIGAPGNRFDVSADGTKILIAVPGEPARATAMTMVLNWVDLLRTRLP